MGEIIFWILYLMQIPNMLLIMQQESYQNDGMIRWISKNPKKAFKTGAICLFSTLAVFVVTSGIVLLMEKSGRLGQMGDIIKLLIPATISGLYLDIFCIVSFIKTHKERKQAKKPLKYTGRIIRLIIYNFFVLIILQTLFMQTIDGDKAFIFEGLDEQGQVVNYQLTNSDIYGPILNAFLIFVIPLNMIIANWFASPLEHAIATWYTRRAYNKLNKKQYKNLIKIGITGSYGKTSTKFILKTILAEKYNVLATPESYNTTLGNVKVIRKQLKPEHEVFISEMGARKKGDIAEICEFVKPQIGIITSIGEQHLETFKNIDNVAKAKNELLLGTKNINNPKWNTSQYDTIWKMTKDMISFSKPNAEDDGELPILKDGAVFLYKDGAKCEELYKKDAHSRKYLFSADKKADVYAKDIKISTEGSTFTVVSKKNKEYECETKLLGEHNVQNIICAIAVAEYLGLTKEEIQNGVSKIEPVEHRLQLLPSSNGTIVIDDAFNSNPKGSKAALDILKEFNERKIIVTPGMVELGDKEAELNREFGIQMADVVDIAILVGPKHTKPIQDALKDKHFDDMNVYVVTSLAEATTTLGKITKAGDVILFENDLPDSYNE